MAPMEVIPVRTWEVHTWSSELKAYSSECHFLHRALAGAGHTFAPSGTGWFVFGRLQSLCHQGWVANTEGTQADRALRGPVGCAPASSESLVAVPPNGAQAGQTTGPAHSTSD